MAAPAPTYDLMLMLDPKAPEADRSKVRSDARSLIERDGSVVADHDYGDRALAYEIDHEKRAEYELIQFQCPPATLDQLSNMLRIADAVTRFRIIKDLPGTPPPPDLRQAAPPAESEPAAEAVVAEESVVEAEAPSGEEAGVVAEETVVATESEAPVAAEESVEAAEPGEPGGPEAAG